MIIIYMHNKSIECHLIGEMLINIECSCCITIQCRTVSVWQSILMNIGRMQKNFKNATIQYLCCFVQYTVSTASRLHLLSKARYCARLNTSAFS